MREVSRYVYFYIMPDSNRKISLILILNAALSGVAALLSNIYFILCCYFAVFDVALSVALFLTEVYILRG